jgi:CBS domain-containing protein
VNISDILRNKAATRGSGVATTTPNASVAEVVRLLADHNVGALVVVEGDSDGPVVGIVSERDVVRHLVDSGTDLLSQHVADIMTTDLFTAGPDHSLDEVAATMTDRRIRHVPVVVDDRLVGVVSIGDVVLSRINQLEQDRSQLENYIAG